MFIWCAKPEYGGSDVRTVAIVVAGLSAIANACEFDTALHLPSSAECSLWIGVSIILLASLRKTIGVNVWVYMVELFSICKLFNTSSPTGILS